MSMKRSNSSNQNLPPLRKILILGSGGRENALAWAMRKCKSIDEVVVLPGNGGTEDHVGCSRLDLEENNIKEEIIDVESKIIPQTRNHTKLQYGI